MDIERRSAVENNPEAKLTEAEMAAGYHYCPEWDGMLIGPEDSEAQVCTCSAGLQISADQYAVAAAITLVADTPEANHLRDCGIRGQTVRLTNFPGITFYVAQHTVWVQNTCSDSDVLVVTYELKVYGG